MCKIMCRHEVRGESRLSLTLRLSGLITLVLINFLLGSGMFTTLNDVFSNSLVSFEQDIINPVRVEVGA